MQTDLYNYLSTLERLKNDNVSSSASIANEMINCSLALFKDGRLKNKILDIIEAQSSMAIVINVGFRILEAVDSNSFETLKSLKEEILEFSNKAIKDAANFLKGVKNIATISYSKTVYDTLLLIKPERVYLSVAHPAKEGEMLANRLCKDNIDAVLFEDSSYSLVMKDVDCVLVGADAIFDNTFVNKTGTFSLALLAREFQVPFYVVSCACKYLDSKKRALFKIKDAPKTEVSDSSCFVINRYFEEVPIKFVNKMFLGR